MTDADAATGGARARASRRFAWVDGTLVATCLASLGVVVAALLVQVSFGTYTMSPSAAWNAVFAPAVWTPEVLARFLLGDGLAVPLLEAAGLSTVEPDLGREALIVWQIRLPRVVVAVMVGANLAVSGAIFQAVTRNELASPFILGVSSGAGLAILLALVVFTGLAALLPVVAALGGAVAFLLVYAIAWQGGTSPVRLVLAGVIVATVFNSLQTGLFFFAGDVRVVQEAIAWTTGSLTGTDWEQARLALPWTLLSLALALAGARQLNVLLLGERTADALGMPVERVRFGLSAVAILAAAASVMVAGVVAFVGLIVPHAVRTLVGSDYKRLMVGCVFAGPALLAAADVGARLGLQVLAGSPVQIPVGIVTGLIGGPYFLYLMRRRGELGAL